MKTRARQLLEKSGLDVIDPGSVPALAPQMSSPPENDMQNNRGFTYPTRKKHITHDGWVKDIYQDTDEAAIELSRPGKGQTLPHSTSDWHKHNPPKSQPNGKSAAEKWAQRLRTAQKNIYLKKAITQSGAPKLTPSQIQPGGGA